jgi:RNA polymerase sigma-70 factor (ECF subfamily)
MAASGVVGKDWVGKDWAGKVGPVSGPIAMQARIGRARIAIGGPTSVDRVQPALWRPAAGHGSFCAATDGIPDTMQAPDEQDDTRLIAAVAQGDAAAFRTLVGRHSRTLYRLAHRLLNDAAEAEDVTQETLVRLWDHAAAWQPRGGGAPAWLRRTATNLCLDRLRRRSRLADVTPPDEADPAPGADAQLDGQRLGEVAQRAIAALPDRQRAAIVLTYYEELPNAEAADTLQMKLKAFESLLLRARSALRAQVRAAGISARDLGGQA